MMSYILYILRLRLRLAMLHGLEERRGLKERYMDWHT